MLNLSLCFCLPYKAAMIWKKLDNLPLCLGSKRHLLSVHAVLQLVSWLENMLHLQKLTHCIHINSAPKNKGHFVIHGQCAKSLAYPSNWQRITAHNICVVSIVQEMHCVSQRASWRKGTWMASMVCKQTTIFWTKTKGPLASIGHWANSISG